MKLLILISSCITVLAGSLEKNSCALVDCAFGARCIVEQGKPKCVCDQVCILLYSPVCGTDGKTYSNSCFLGLTNCQEQKYTKIAHEGECSMNPCARIRCPLGQNCVNQSGIALCIRPKITCAAVLCVRGTTCVIKKGKALCVPVADPCDGFLCPPSLSCLNQNGVAACKRPKITCAAVSCLRGTKCVIKNGKTFCIPIRKRVYRRSKILVGFLNPCRYVACLQGFCVVEQGMAVCKVPLDTAIPPTTKNST